MTTDYTRIIENILVQGHPANAGVVNFVDDEQDGYLVLDPITKQITPENGFSTIIGTTNEINANIITFILPYTDDHPIQTCDYHVIKWHNLASGEKGIGTLSPKTEELSPEWVWIIPPEAFTAAGTLKIAISIYDEDDNGNITFQWNSLPYLGLTIAKGMDEISIKPINEDSIILLDLYTRKIIIPSGLNTQIGIAGEQGINVLKFRCDRYYLDLDFYTYKFYILYTLPNGDSYAQEISPINLANKPANDSFFNSGELLEFEYSIPYSWTQNQGNITFAIQAVSPDQKKAWKSEANSSLTVKDSLSPESEGPIDDIIIDFEELTYIFDAGDASEFY